MNKYLEIFKISLQQEFVYRLNFILWRLRNILQVFLIFFLWDAAFAGRRGLIFGYNREAMLTYVFGMMIIKAVVYSSRSIDIAGDIARGDLSNFLLKPVSYFKYWFTRDMSTKLLNLVFAAGEATLLFIFFKPPLLIQQNFLVLLLFFAFLLMALALYFGLVIAFGLIPFWFPDNAWAGFFLFMIFADFLGGVLFPLDILPGAIRSILFLTPFPYILFVPLQIYLNKFSTPQIIGYLLTGGFWLVFLYIIINRFWRMGLKKYRAEGR